MKLCCAAPSPDPKRPARTCNYPLARVPSVWDCTFLGIVHRMPELPDGHLYLLCGRCKSVNKFRLLSPPEGQSRQKLLAPGDAIAVESVR